MGVDDWADSISDWWNTSGNDIANTFTGSWDSFKDTVLNGKTVQELWNDFKDGSEELFKKGCLAIKGTEDQTGCCNLNQVIKCSGAAIKKYGAELTDKAGDAFKEGCEGIGGTVERNSNETFKLLVRM